MKKGLTHSFPTRSSSDLADMFKWTDSVTAEDLKDFMDEKLYNYAKDCLDIRKENKDNDKDDAKKKYDQATKDLHAALLTNWSCYQSIIKKAKEYLNLLPPSAAMAGIYTMVDNTRGVWKAPANVSVNYVNSPTENINDSIQEGLNMPMNGKAINVIRTFPGEGIKVWGARTLNGNSQDWRYVNVRRTMLFLEESVKNASRAYVFLPAL